MNNNTEKHLLMERKLPSVAGYDLLFSATIEPAVRGKHLGIAHVKLIAKDGVDDHTLKIERDSTLSFYESITEEYIENLWRSMALKLYTRASTRV